MQTYQSDSHLLSKLPKGFLLSLSFIESSQQQRLLKFEFRHLGVSLILGVVVTGHHSSSGCKHPSLLSLLVLAESLNPDNLLALQAILDQTQVSLRDQEQNQANKDARQATAKSSKTVSL